MRISELAQRTGVSPHALRHYERLGLLRPGRTAGGYRDYPEAMRREVVFIAMSRKIGFSLASIAQHLPDYRAGRLGFDDMVQAMQARVAEIDEAVAALTAQRKQVTDHIRWMKEQKKKHQASRQGAARKPWPTTPTRKERP